MVHRNGLENRDLNGLVGSNPSPSANRLSGSSHLMYKKIAALFILNWLLFFCVYIFKLIQLPFFQTVLTVLSHATSSQIINRLLMIGWISIPQLGIIILVGYKKLHLAIKKILIIHLLWIITTLIIISILFAQYSATLQ